GIRYWSVTGVQTCALPISDEERRRDYDSRRSGLAPHRESATGGAEPPRRQPDSKPQQAQENAPSSDAKWPVFLILVILGLVAPRSEERRVGKEVSAVWTQE